ncbi:unnamed protein product [Brachionus calyciflorus]|uniref:Uncharacterized protein n=1 Tax=Brachionus calyciflorus TaxID=104777 RepID=A0A813WKQ3_9BILA|nr:unnamed protein product [Brachionus calyciflorus]
MLKFFILAIIFVIIKLSNGCNNKCQYQSNNENKICYGKAQECILLICNVESNKFPKWIRQSLEVNTTIVDISGGILNNITLYQPVNKNELNLTSLRAIDSGLNSFLTFIDEKLECKFNIFGFDLDNWNGTLTIFDDSKQINSSENFNIELKTFSKKLNFTYQYEALPLDHLTFNETILNSETCEGNFPWLNCLVARDVKIDLPKCIKNLNLHLGYKYENDYSGLQTQPQTRNFTHSLTFTYPPQTIKKKAPYTFNDSDKYKDLKCEVECAHPNDLTYEFVLVNNTEHVLLQNTSTDTLRYNLDSGENEIEIICTVYNSINHDPLFKNESQTTFFLTYQSSTDAITTDAIITTFIQTINTNTTDITEIITTGKETTIYVTNNSLSSTVVTTVSNSSCHNNTENTGLETWAIVIIIVASVLILVVVVLLIFLVYFLIRRSGSYKKDRKFSDSTLDITVKQRQLNSGLEVNPVYGNNMKSSPSPVGRSDPNQTIL